MFRVFPQLLGEVSAKKFHPDESMGAEALLQAIAVLESQPSTQEQPGAKHTLPPDA